MSQRSLRLISLCVGVAAACVCRGDADEGVLWWCVGSDAKVDGAALQQGVDYSARVRVSNASTGKGTVSGDVFLNLYVESESGSGYAVANGAVYADVPVSSPYYASLGTYGSTDYVFSIELGAWSGDTFTVVGVSDTWSYTEISNAIASNGTAFSPGSMPTTVLTPTTFSSVAPEPGSGLLLLVGGGLLALRRRRRGYRDDQTVS